MTSVLRSHSSSRGHTPDILHPTPVLTDSEHQSSSRSPGHSREHTPRESPPSTVNESSRQKSKSREPKRRDNLVTTAENIPSSSNTSKRKKNGIVSRDAVKRINPALVLENSGSVARDHLASERTFLAYVRTSLALASMGVALVQLFTIAELTSKSTGVPLPDTSKRLQKFARPLGIVAVMFAFIVLMIGVYRFFRVQHALPEKKFPTARFSIVFISFVLGGINVVVFGALLGGIPKA
ncbi:hypothetical protein B0H34DRAFT_778410 [Crassisporium funariophilum]|nr:hypothetical protein B0H34DRAFT_778410 [Crassisporium funariophilum]